jgi:hypothetical protein
MHVKTGPVVESSTNLRIGCSILHYPELEQQMRDAHLDPGLNCWTDLHDFTPGDGHFELHSGVQLELPMMDRSGATLPFTRIPPRGAQTFKYRVARTQTAKLAELSMTDEVCLVSTAADGSNLICAFSGESAGQVEGLIAALNPTRCQ